MTVLTVLAVLENTLPSVCLSFKIQLNEATVALLKVLAVSAVMTVSVMTATPLSSTPFSVILTFSLFLRKFSESFSLDRYWSIECSALESWKLFALGWANVADSFGVAENWFSKPRILV